jgi:molybdate transport system ATP-binding protein
LRARALARRPAALLLDEPLSALDARTRASAGRELASVLRDTGVPTLLVTHDFIEAALLGDQIGVIDGGRVAQIGTAAELAASPASAFVADSRRCRAHRHRPAGRRRAHPRRPGRGRQHRQRPARDGPVAVSVYPWEITSPPKAHGPAARPRTTCPSR